MVNRKIKALHANTNDSKFIQSVIAVHPDIFLSHGLDDLPFHPR